MNFNQNKSNKCILRAPEVCKRTGLSLSWLHALMKKNLFPKNFKIVPGGRASGWYESEVDSFIESRGNGGQADGK